MHVVRSREKLANACPPAPAQPVHFALCCALQVYGVYWLLVATAAYRLSQAADNGNLSSATYQRLNAFLALFSIGSALPLLQVIDSLQ